MNFEDDDEDGKYRNRDDRQDENQDEQVKKIINKSCNQNKKNTYQDVLNRWKSKST